MKRLKTISLFLLFLGFVLTVFLYGVGVGNFQWPPYKLLKSVKSGQIFETPVVYKGKDGELLQFAFRDPIINSELLYDPIISIDGVYEANLSCLLLTEQFFDAYQQMDLLSDETFFLDEGATNICKLTYMLAGKEYESYAYKLDGLTHNSTAALLIPGSGQNQSSAIYYNDPGNYHFGMLDLLKKNGVDVYIYIKPNHDILAWHNGRHKLDETTFSVNWHLNQGSSYSGSYIASSMAFTKHIQENYKMTIVAGLSQGAYAAFLNAIQSEPDIAIISSGYSIINSTLQGAGHNQIIMPGVDQVYNPEVVAEILSSQKTQYFFSYGKQEDGLYKIEAEEKHTCEHFWKHDNVNCITHDFGHVFPVQEIERFLNQNTR